jgi:hypothetical protein
MGHTYLGSVQDIPTSLKLMVHIFLSLNPLPWESIIRHGEHAV